MTGLVVAGQEKMVSQMTQSSSQRLAYNTLVKFCQWIFGHHRNILGKKIYDRFCSYSAGEDGFSDDTKL